jgi:hypothetical protein
MLTGYRNWLGNELQVPANGENPQLSGLAKRVYH